MSSSSGAQCQVAVRGAQDVFLLSANENTFFKTTYARATNFAVTEIEMPFNNAAGFGRQKFSCTVSRAGDLLSSMYVAITLPPILYPAAIGGVSLYNPTAAVPSYAYWVNTIGHAILQEVDVNIGQHEYDSHYGEFLEIFEAVSAPSDRLLQEMTGRYNSTIECAQASLLEQHLYVPLKFWFNRFTEQSLPLVALYWHDTTLTFSTRPRSALFSASGAAAADLALAAPTITVPTDVSDMHMLCNFVYLDRPERAAFANSKSEYVIDQTQTLGQEAVTLTSTTINHNARFNHPVTELLWVIRQNAAVAANDWFNFNGGIAVVPNLVGIVGAPSLVTDPFESAAILINNQNRTIDHPAIYYRTVQMLQSHNRFPASDRKIYCYSFGLKPEELLHTGSVNMSRLDSSYVQVTYHSTDPILPAVAGNFLLFARNKNGMFYIPLFNTLTTHNSVMKITVGMAGLKFAA